MLDQYGRNITYLRISITDRCNLRCKYCMPDGVTDVGMKNILTFEEIWEIVRAGVSLGITHVRITGGEPLVRKGCVDLIRGIRAIPGVETITMTTNGVLLRTYAASLKEAGLDGLNVSLDTLDFEEFASLAGRQNLKEVLDGIQAAKEMGLPVKINAVNRKELNPISLVLYAQQQKISVSIKELPLKEAINQIAEKASMNVAYSKEFVDTNRKVSLEVKDTEVNRALTLLLKGTNIGFRFLDDSILFYNKEYQNKTEPVEPQESRKELYVKGKVTDENAEAIIGATVSVKGATTGTITDINGQYSIKVPYGSTLCYSYVGYREESVIAKATTVNVVMKENAVSLEDVVVVGYGVQKKVNVTGAVSMVKAEAIENRPITNVTTGLQGLLPGVSIVSSSGQPGAVPSINIRGTGTINSSTAPLILIDGVAGGDII